MCARVGVASVERHAGSARWWRGRQVGSTDKHMHQNSVCDCGRTTRVPRPVQRARLCTRRRRQRRLRLGLACVVRAHLCGALLEGGVDESKVGVVLCLGVHAGADEVVDGHLDGVHVDPVCGGHGVRQPQARESMSAACAAAMARCRRWGADRGMARPPNTWRAH
jgi:hypothetical protein